MKKGTVFNLLAILGIVMSIILLAINWGSLPEQIPAHFGIDGTPDSYAPKWTILLFPTIMIVIYLLMSLLMIKRPWMVKNYPYTITEENKEAHYKIIRQMGLWLRFSIIWTFVFIEYLMIDFTSGNQILSGFTALIPIAVVIFVTILIMRKGKHIK